MRSPLSALLSALACCAMLVFALPPAIAAQKSAMPSGAKSNDVAPLGKLPRWAVPQSYQLQFRVDPKQDRYSGTTTIKVDLKKSSDHLWLHGQELNVGKVTVIDAAGRPHAGSYLAVAPKEGVARIDFGTVLKPQTLTLSVDFDAPFNEQLQGLYKVSDAGQPYAMTQMEPISARVAFPCFDEPDFKTPFTLSLTIPNDEVAVANTAQISERRNADGWKTLNFASTRPLPTYLVAWAVGPWDIVNGPDIPKTQWRDHVTSLRGVAPHGQGARMQHALSETPAIIETEEAYYGFGYPWDKLDLLAAPDFSAGAMENAGLVTFRDWLLLLDKDSSARYVRSSFNVIAHELAHQWTGDTVTMPWWNDIWLNEAFATWMQQKVTEKLHPEYRADLDRVEGAEGAMANDSLVSARKIRQPITGNGDIDTAFDSITYEKGAAVLGMFEGFVSPEVFQRGMRAYIAQHKFGNADADDLVDAIATAANKGVAFKRDFKSFLDQSGVPLIATKLDCKGKQPVLHLIQSRYLPLGSGGDADRLWGVPVCVRYGAEKSSVQCQMLDAKQADMPLAVGQCPAWYMPNADARGYYRFEMDKVDLDKLGNALPRLSDAEQLAYADAIDADFRRGDLEAHDALVAMAKLARSPTRLVALSPLDTVQWIYRYEARNDAQRASVRRAVAAAYLPKLEALGYQRKAGESADDALLRASLAGSLGLDFDVPQVRAELLTQGGAALRKDDDGRLNLAAANPDLLGSALSVAVQVRGKSAVEALISEIGKTNEAAKRNAMLTALGQAQGDQGDRVRDFALSGQVKVGEMAMVLRGAQDNAREREALWNWFTHHYDQVLARTGSFAGGMLPRLAGGGGCSQADADRLTAFFTPRLGDLPGADRGLAQTRESALLCAALKAKQTLAPQ